MRIGLPLIDIAASFLIVIAASGIALGATAPQQNAFVQRYTEAEMLRIEAYAIFYSGTLVRIADTGSEEFPIDFGNVTVSLADPDDQGVLIFVSSEGGERVFAVVAKD